MTLTPSLRKLALTLHVVTSVGWVGAVAGFLALAIAGLISPDIQLVRAGYIAMDLTYRSVVVPLGLAALTTGVISSLGTEWGLFRYYWIVVKLLLTVPATVLMLVHMQPVRHMADVVATNTLASSDLADLRTQLVAYTGAALVVLLASTALSTYKPRGRTGVGTRKPQAWDATGDRPSAALTILLAIFAVLLLMFLAAHLTGLHGPHLHGS